MLTLVMAYYENPVMLAHHLHEWRAWSDRARKEIAVVIVDDGSPRNPAIDVLQGFNVLQLSLYRIDVNIPWNQDGARNLAMKEAKTDWVLMTDMDHLLLPSEADRLLDMPKQRGYYYMPARRTIAGKQCEPHFNSYVMHRKDFWRIGGYDEDFAGFYGSDGNFRKRMKAYKAREVNTEAFYLTQVFSTDVADSNTREWGRKKTEWAASSNKFLREKNAATPYVAADPLRFPYRRLI